MSAKAKLDAQTRLAREAIKGGQTYEAPDAIDDDKIYDFNPNETYHEQSYSEAWKEHRPKEYFDYRELWDFVPRNKIVRDFPIHLDIETTNVCNLRCPMCPRTVMLAEDNFSNLGFMTREEYQGIIDEAVKHDVKSIKLNYLGEPTSHPDVVWHVEYAKKMGVLDVMMNSNGTLLTKKMARNLLKAGLDNMFISFDALNPADYEVQRVGTTMGKVIDNTYGFIKLRNEINPGCQVRISMVMYKEPKWLEQFEGLKIMWKGLVDGIGYGFFVDRDWDKLGDYAKVEGFHCAQPFQRMFLKYNGNTTVCCTDDKDVLTVGNWHKQSLYDIWNGELYRGVRDTHACGNYDQIDICRKCYLPVST